MCGISGIVSNGAGRELRTVVDRAVSRQRHRGPDESGVWVGEGVVLGHNRLSIIDLSGGRQPMREDAGRFTIVFNGEIYNFRELRRNLEQTGDRFSTSSDTEVLLKLYRRHGAECLQYLNGMFAFAVWDERERTLFLARDRLGVKPVYYWIDGSELRFASELSALTEGEAGLTLDEEALLDYLSYLYVPAPRTIYAQVKKLPPAHYLTWKDGTVSVRKYWNPWHIQPDDTLSTEEWAEKLRPLFLDAVRSRLVSDVPLGAFLSGGVDSSAVVAAMATMTDRPVKTFSIGFEGDPSNELPYAREIAQLYKTDHVERIISPSDVPDLLQLVSQHFGEPFADSSAIPTLAVSALARENVTVALSGDGGDELFAGYGAYRYYQWLAGTQRMFGRFASPLGRAARWMPEKVVHRFSTPRRAKVFLSKLGMPLAQQWSISKSILSRGSAPVVLTPALYNKFQHRAWVSHLGPYFEGLDSLGPVDQLTRVDMQTYLPDDLLVKVDRMSMARSLEVRSPFLDYRLVELALAIPVRHKLRKGSGKWILKKTLEPYLPLRLLRRRKQGFTVPLEQWFGKELSAFAREILLDGSAERGFIEKKGVAQILDAHDRKETDHDDLIWALLVLETWFRAREGKN